MLTENWREREFGEVTARSVYLNHAGVGPAPARVVRAVEEAVRLAARDPLGFFIDGVLPKRESARERMARLIGIPPDDLALTKNTGHGLALAADALRLDPGDNIMSVDCEYPSVVYPWYAQADRGIETRLIPTRPDGTFTLEDIDACMDDRTRAITLSWVQFGTGFRADLQAIAELAHSRNAIMIADVIQGLGALPMNAADWGLDIVATGVHKWLLAPGGTGGLYISPALLDRMRLVNMGALSVVDVPKFDPLDFSPKPTAQRYEEGTPNGLGLWGLDAALSLIEEVGIDAIARRVLALTHLGAELLNQKGYQVVSPREDDKRAGLLMFRHADKPNEAVLEALQNVHVAAAIRGGNLRFSPHFYNTEEEMARAVDSLP